MNAIKADEPPSCRISRSVGLYADGELEPNRSIEVEMHLAVCESCREELELIRAMRKSLRRSTVRQAPKGFEERMRALVAQKAQQNRNDEKSVAEHVASHLASKRALESASEKVASSDTAGSAVAPLSDEGTSEDRSHDAVSAIPSQLATTEGTKTRTRRGFGRFRMSWGTAMAMAAAASFVVAFFATRSQRADSVARLPMLKASSAINPIAVASTNGTPSQNDSAADRGNFDQLIERLVTLHAHPVPPETSNFDEAVDRFNGTLGVGLDRHTLRKPFGANFSGARMHVIEFREPDIEPTAELRYVMQGHRITIYVFDPRRVPIRLSHLSQRVVRSAPVYVGRVRGFSVAAAETSGVGYAMASDLDADRSAQLVAEIR